MLYLPVFYCTKALVYERKEHADIRTLVEVALNKWQDNLVKDVKMAAAVIIPMDLVIFSVCPIQWRLSGMAFAGLFWALALSLTRGGKDNPKSGDVSSRGDDLI